MEGGETMPYIDAVNTAVYKILSGDIALGELCTVYKGAKRPGGAVNPSVTADTKRLMRGEGEGIWKCDIVITVYADVLANRTADHVTLDAISGRVRALLADAEPELAGAKALPIFEGESSSPEWMSAHTDETVQADTYGLIFIDFGAVYSGG